MSSATFFSLLLSLSQARPQAPRRARQQHTGEHTLLTRMQSPTARSRESPAAARCGPRPRTARGTTRCAARAQAHAAPPRPALHAACFSSRCAECGRSASTSRGSVCGMPPVISKSSSRPASRNSCSTGAASALYTCRSTGVSACQPPKPSWHSAARPAIAGAGVRSLQGATARGTHLQASLYGGVVVVGAHLQVRHAARGRVQRRHLYGRLRGGRRQVDVSHVEALPAAAAQPPAQALFNQHLRPAAARVTPCPSVKLPAAGGTRKCCTAPRCRTWAGRAPLPAGAG